MTDTIWIATFIAALGSGLVAGIFYGFSSFIMRALSDVAAGAEAMNRINVRVITPSFLVVFLGTALLSLGLAGYGLWAGGHKGMVLVLGGLAYFLGCFGVTMRLNVPLNNRLAAAEKEGGLDAMWQDYLVRWTRWNSIRTAFSLLAMMLFIVVLIRP